MHWIRRSIGSKPGQYTKCSYQSCMYCLLSVALLFFCFVFSWVQYFPRSNHLKIQPPYKAAERFGTDSCDVLFVQTTDSLHLSPLTSCAIESAARTYKGKRVCLYMKGWDEKLKNTTAVSALDVLKSLSNVKLLPLNPVLVFRDTPLEEWYQSVNPEQETYWPHVQSDAFRYALLWQNGGIYMDTDVISFKPIPEANFLGFESTTAINGAVLGSKDHHPFLDACMKDFVTNYEGSAWGHQGPLLLTRVLQRLCNFTEWDPDKDLMCTSQKFIIFKSSRLYPIPYYNWKLFYNTSDNLSIFSDSYATHVWNQMNQWDENEKRRMKVGDRSLLENIFKLRCQLTYAELYTWS
ncbi:alpha-1,4-N-acetylglucosaminyltransferase-like isoform X2 [Protopterus annectens]|uniref:alpha-1,4-N-acetylglucosaminyltransferase-like isoform X2 n=1 Tax=Protopterus annectens TaxID=7888 RepID=UPI001CFB535E|nr:alpha-1,4-N-acetylglucosaminyltransferase-like isoform X2 [Protopterus annectens]